jgi:uroporphyrin-III C-methyltransferase
VADENTLNDLPPELMGLVSLVGAGPGDPELITMKGLRRLREAELVAYDRLVNPILLRECNPKAELIYVGKHDPNRPTQPQQTINQLLIDTARSGKSVVRLKGGDPFVFGRGGEEAAALREAGVPFEVVPGISSAVAAPAYAGIPVTHRGLASSVAIVTGHDADDSQEEQRNVDWSALATATDTLVVLMGVKRLEFIIAELIRHGRPAQEPAALISWGTTSDQKTVVATLATLALEARKAELGNPATLVIGQVVSLHPTLDWFIHDKRMATIGTTAAKIL